jgi:hypothetical protein
VSKSKVHKSLLLERYNNFHFLSKKAPSFEGFYCKVAQQDGTTLVVICGYAKSAEKAHFFIQVSTQSANTLYFEYPIDKLIPHTEGFSFSINGNQISSKGIVINEKNCTIDLTFTKFSKWKRTLTKPSIMGVLTYVPFVECKHDVISPYFEVSGNATIENTQLEFTDDAGYIDKNWGKSFPKKYIWGHVAGFEKENIAIQFAQGSPSWLFWNVPVHLGFLRLNDNIYTFNSWKGGKMTMINVGHKEVYIRSRKFKIHLTFKKGSELKLKAPINGKVEDNIVESAGIETKVLIHERKLFSKDKLVINETVFNSTLEIKKHTK